MPKKPVNLTLEEDVLDYAKQIQQARKFGNMVGLVEQLLREEYVRLGGQVRIQGEPDKLAAMNDLSSAQRVETMPGAADKLVAPLAGGGASPPLSKPTTYPRTKLKRGNGPAVGSRPKPNPPAGHKHQPGP